MNACTKDTHILETNLYCNTCKYSICAKCIRNHKMHDIVDSDSVYEESLEDAGKYQEKLKEILMNRKTDIESCETSMQEITALYEKLKREIDIMFREYVDMIHFRQIETKRELQSLYDDILEHHMMQLSKLENDSISIDSSLLQIKQLSDGTLEDKSSFVQKFSNLKISNTVSEKSEIDNAIYSLPVKINRKEVQQHSEKFQYLKIMDTLVKPIPIQPIVDININGNGNDKPPKYMYSTDILSLEIWDLNNNKSIVIKLPQTTFSVGRYLITQNQISTPDCIYLFGRSHGMRLDLKKEIYQWEQIDYGGKVLPEYTSTIYHPTRKAIYIIGGLTGGGNLPEKRIFKYFVDLDQLVEINCTLIQPTQCPSLSFVDHYIYIIGGSTLINRDIQKFDTIENRICLVTNMDISSPFSACVVYNAVYMHASKDNSFHRLFNNQIYTLPSPPIIVKNMALSRLYHDNDEGCIYLLNAYSGDRLYKFDLPKSQWSIAIPKLSNKVISYDNIMFSNFCNKIK
ncbi:hypothetical protein DLAC_07642 [Tieghemostelium lacteum]|uniref:B box-type domain-containing protein n=1 Tax=Tieghemostelium lacteum TaxID=361077 RepID=A0A151ZD22_TIELA|nr:hypothetical protein DLAC_07642 [Tieghemostelium lacteum]|eukprot:KYQ91840.1 hypothetical protein DLAC_07642 [Tieghemostelium lacteum]